MWLRLAADAADAALLRADARRNLLAVARVIGWSADPRTGRSRPTITRITAATGLGKRTVQRWCRWLEAAGLLEVLEPGTTPQYRPGLLTLAGDKEPGNLAREWLLTAGAPADVDETGTPPKEPDPKDTPTRARARENRQTGEDLGTARRCAADPRPADPAAPPPAQPGWPAWQNPQRRGDQLAAAEQLQADRPVLRAMSAAAVRSAAREFFTAGWTPADIAHALDHQPDGTTHRHTDPVRVPARWLAWRLAQWRRPDQAPARSASQARADTDRVRKARQAAFRAQVAAGRSAAVDSAAPAERARQLLAAASPQAARVISLRAARPGRPTR